jgi:hypothetical protein
MEIDVPSIHEQQIAIFEEATKHAIAQLKKNLKAKRLEPQNLIDENEYPRTHLLREDEGWEPPHKEIVVAYFRHFQNAFPEYDTDAKLAKLLGLSSDRRVREYKGGARKVPYGVWNKFLVLTGRVPQDVLPVLAFMG